MINERGDSMAVLTDSILNTVKEGLNLEADYDAFDSELITYINSALSVLTQIGVGSNDGFDISDSTSTWVDFIGDNDKLLNMVPTYVILKTKILFDPPINSTVMEANKSILAEYEWRINSAVDEMFKR